MTYVASPINKARASWALAALKEFQRITGTDKGDAMSDLLSDLMHLSQQRPEGATNEEHYEDFRDALARAEDNLRAESQGED